MKWLYGALSSGLIVFGVIPIFEDVLYEAPAPLLVLGPEFDVMVGMPLIMLGILNLLSLTYGRIAPGVRYTAIGLNVCMFLILVWLSWGQMDRWVVVGWVLFAVMTLFSTSRHFLLERRTQGDVI